MICFHKCLYLQVEKLAGLNKGDLNDIRVENKEITFKVNHNNKNITALDVVKTIGKFFQFYTKKQMMNLYFNLIIIIYNNILEKSRSTLEETFGVNIVRSGIGDKVSFYFLTFFFLIKNKLN